MDQSACDHIRAERYSRADHLQNAHRYKADDDGVRIPSRWWSWSAVNDNFILFCFCVCMRRRIAFGFGIWIWIWVTTQLLAYELMYLYLGIFLGIRVSLYLCVGWHKTSCRCCCSRRCSNAIGCLLTFHRYTKIKCGYNK